MDLRDVPLSIHRKLSHFLVLFYTCTIFHCRAVPSFIEQVLYLMNNLVVFTLLQLQAGDLIGTSLHTCPRKSVGEIPIRGNAGTNGNCISNLTNTVYHLAFRIFSLEYFLFGNLSNSFTLSSKLRMPTISSLFLGDSLIHPQAQLWVRW